MGSFDVGCGISNLAIHMGDKVGFILIEKNTKGESDFWTRNRGTAMNIYTTDMYQPMFPPVFAVYDDYGRVAEVEKSTTTEMLEVFFRRPVNVVIDCVNENRGIYDSYGPIFENYALEGALIGSFNANFEEKMISVGFTRDEESNEQAIAYVYGDYRVMHYPQSNKALVSDIKNGKILDGNISVYNDDVKTVLKSFAKHTGLYPGYALEDVEAITTLSKASGMFFLKDVYDGMEKHLLAEETYVEFYLNRYVQKWESFMERFDADKNWTVEKEIKMNFSYDIFDFIHRSSMMPLSAIELLDMYKEDREDFFKMRYLPTILTQVNRMLMPSICGEQHGNDEASQRLNALTEEILKVRAEDY